MIFVQSIMDSNDALAPAINSSNKEADLDYGPHDPQHPRTCSSARSNKIKLCGTAIRLLAAEG
jgi:hypothetical protein